MQTSSLTLIGQALSCDNDHRSGRSSVATFAVKFDKQGWIPGAVVSAMRMHAGDIDVQTIGCGIINALIDPSLYYVKGLLNVKALDAVVDALALAMKLSHESQAAGHNGSSNSSAAKATSIKRNTYDIIIGMFPVNLPAKDAKSKPVVKNVKLILESMSTHMDSPDMLASAMRSIHATSYFNMPNANALGKDGVRITFNAMRAHEGTSEVQMSGYAALSFLIHKSLERKAYAHELGCLKHVLRVMRKYASQSSVQVAACMFLGFMMDDFFSDADDVYRTELGDLDFVTTVCKALRTHVRNDEVALHAAETLHRFTFIKSGAYRFNFFKEGGCDAVMHAMEVNKNNIHILVSAQSTRHWQAANIHTFSRLLNSDSD